MHKYNTKFFCKPPVDSLAPLMRLLHEAKQQVPLISETNIANR